MVTLKANNCLVDTILGDFFSSPAYTHSYQNSPSPNLICVRNAIFAHTCSLFLLRFSTNFCRAKIMGERDLHQN